ncbi:vacuolar import and degradation protein-domain-containing protein [Pisolithus croceorrhizus]|nr:vacuolar import and degradation protein-domain-containing protein [Pisolithus croceorrhizus]KAI6168763.1 vacuolar import and degradation protein-domain-containing protein [Pisolithus thermaeus]
MSLPNPSINITCLQNCGPNSYDVTITIVDVNLSSSFLCRYLCICGLTEDWLELTMYFNTEIMGNQHGFLTQKWDASEQDDMVHWQRFPAFHHRFLIPDHRVISSLSFASFYYVCMEFNLWSPVSTTLHSTMVPEGSETSVSTLLPPRHHRCDSSVQRAGNGLSVGPHCPLPATTISGFYYHPKSELFQQLSLTHVAQTFSSKFEFC